MFQFCFKFQGNQRRQETLFLIKCGRDSSEAEHVKGMRTERQRGRQRDRQAGRQAERKAQDFTSCLSVAVPLAGPPAPATKSGVRKKRASETYLKIDVLLLTNDHLRALRVQNEICRRGKIQFSENALGPPRAGAGFVKKRDRAQRGENFHFGAV